jgi:hypothetical protein
MAACQLSFGHISCEQELRDVPASDAVTGDVRANLKLYVHTSHRCGLVHPCLLYSAAVAITNHTLALALTACKVHLSLD